MLIFRAVGLQIRPSGADKCCCTAISDIEYEKSCCRIANAYIQSSRITNPTERKKVVVALQMLIFRAVGFQIRPSGGMSEVKLKEN